MFSDCFFQIGSSHEVCEDYAMMNRDFAVVSDGCSNGGGPSLNSDWGSRLLCMSAMRNADLMLVDSMDYIRNSLTHAKIWGTTVTLRPEAITATLLSLCKHEGGVKGLVVGDGLIGGIKHDDTWAITTYNFIAGGERECSAPVYPIYLDRQQSFDNYLKQFGGISIRREYTGDLFGELSEVPIETQLKVPADALFEHQFSADEFKYTFVGTDGWFSFYDQNRTATSIAPIPVDCIRALQVIFDKPSKRPNFLKVQKNWSFRRAVDGTYLKRNWSHHDDIAMAGIWL